MEAADSQRGCRGQVNCADACTARICLPGIRRPRACLRAGVFCNAGSGKGVGLLLANVLGPQVDVTQYLVSEKFDGVRAVWDGTTLRFRSGREVPAPAWWLAEVATDSARR